ncbi:MAG: HAMP domain-containing protein [Spirochaetes bacterium]|nr:HAMP domain-containing protein [Spirochaetota bacterium]
MKSRRIQTTIALAFASLVFVTSVVIAILSYSFTQQAVRRTSQDYTEQLITQVQTNIDSYITHMENIAEVVQLNDQVQTYLRGADELSGSAAAEYRNRITTFLNSISRTRADISLILIAGDNGRVLTNDPEIELNSSITISEQDWYQAAQAHSGSAVISSSHVQNIVDGEYRWVITLSRTVNNPQSGAGYGVMLVDLNFSVINDLLSNISLGKKGYLFIVDSTGRIVYHPRQELLYSNLEREHIDRVLDGQDGSFAVTDEKGERIYTVRTSGQTGWKTVGVNYASELVQNRATIQRYYIYWALACIVVAVFVSVLISHRLSQPIMRLRTSMQAVEQGSFDVTAEVSANNEIGDLAKDFNIMVAQIKELMRRNAEEQEQKRKSELMALQNQITPHFLYNTLDSVIWMAEGKQHSNVVATVSALARLLRLSVSRGDELISIHDEIEHIKNYLTIQKLRYRDTLDFMIDVDEDVLHLRTPKVILQPLVENAIYHGIKNKDGGGHVIIRGTRRGKDVVLSVRDDGVGMSDERLQSLLPEAGPFAGSPRRGADGEARTAVPERQKGPTPATGAVRTARREADSSRLPRRRGRVGVRNVHERIQLYFGTGYGLSFDHNNGAGTVVEVRLPVITGDDAEDGEGNGA